MVVIVHEAMVLLDFYIFYVIMDIGVYFITYLMHVA